MEQQDVFEQAYQVRLAHVFEGPMDLLVHLIRKNELDIYDIPIAFITERFLAYIEWMKTMNINVAADFLVMAATLAHIKSRTLLPDSQPESREDEDPRDAIAGPIIEYLRMKSAAKGLAERNILNQDVFGRKPAEKDRHIQRNPPRRRAVAQGAPNNKLPKWEFIVGRPLRAQKSGPSDFPTRRLL